MGLDLEKIDRECIWHPFTQMYTAQAPLMITKGRGSFVYTKEGIPYLDAISSWWVNLHGHAHPFIAEAIGCQARELEHVMFADCTHPPAIELSFHLLSLLGRDRNEEEKLRRIFYSDNGSTAVECALKIAFQYEYHKNPDTKRKRVVSFKGGYHGDTFGAMAASGKHALNRPFWDHFFAVDWIEVPYKGQEELSYQQMEEVLDREETACFIFEPLVLGAGGMHLYSAQELDRLMALCRERGVLAIADEVMTGFGRVGPLFASEKLRHMPDLLCLSKGITGGFLPLGATVCKEEIFEAFLSEKVEKAFLHGHSYSGNPIACASALASLHLLEGSTLARERIAQSHLQFCAKWGAHPRLKRCESIGTLLVVEYCSADHTYFSSLRDRLSHFFLAKQLLLRPLGPVICVLPPYCITQEELLQIYQALILSFEEV